MERCSLAFGLVILCSMILTRTNAQTSAPASAGSNANNGFGQFGDAVATVTPFPPNRDNRDTISRVNNGISTILGGVRNLSLEQILRGSFVFTRNENVRSVANNVLDNVFTRDWFTGIAQPQQAQGQAQDQAKAQQAQQL